MHELTLQVTPRFDSEEPDTTHVVAYVINFQKWPTRTL